MNMKKTDWSGGEKEKRKLEEKNKVNMKKETDKNNKKVKLIQLNRKARGREGKREEKKDPYSLFILIYLLKDKQCRILPSQIMYLAKDSPKDSIGIDNYSNKNVSFRPRKLSLRS